VRKILAALCAEQILDDEGLSTLFCIDQFLCRRTSTVKEGGDKSSIWLMCFGGGGQGNICLACRKDRSG
jgi:hypothetical protein